MLGLMRTTVRLDEGLMREAKAEAARRGETVTGLIEQGLRLVLGSRWRRPRRAQVVLPVSRAVGGMHAGVDLDDSGALLDRMDGRR